MESESQGFQDWLAFLETEATRVIEGTVDSPVLKVARGATVCQDHLGSQARMALRGQLGLGVQKDLLVWKDCRVCREIPDR